MDPLLEPFCKSATFTCNCCAYSTTIYSDIEWLDVTEELFCDECNGDCYRNCDAGMIYRDDLDEEVPLHMQMTTLPAGKHQCDHCIQHNSRIHWTEQLVHCHHCDKDSMLFTEYTVGENILLFYEQCVDAAKPADPPMLWIEKNGGKKFDISGTGEGFSSN